MPFKKRKDIPYITQTVNSRIGGINSSNASQLKKIKKLKITSEKPIVPTSDFYMYVDKKWIHKGLACRYCGSILTDEIVRNNHQYICRVLNKKAEED
jgi:hypothetical protein